MLILMGSLGRVVRRGRLCFGDRLGGTNAERLWRGVCLRAAAWKAQLLPWLGVVSVEFSSCEGKEPRYPVNLPKDNDLGVGYLQVQRWAKSRQRCALHGGRACDVWLSLEASTNPHLDLRGQAFWLVSRTTSSLKIFCRSGDFPKISRKPLYLIF